MKLRSVLTATAGTAVAALVLSGCAGGGDLRGSSSTDDVGWNDATASLEGVTLSFGGGTIVDPGVKAVQDEFARETGVEWEQVVYPDPYEQTLLTKVAAGDMPDLAAWQPTASQLAPLQPSRNLLPLDDAPWLDRIDPAVRDVTGFFGDTRYAALNSAPSVIGVYYNKQVFEEYGIDGPPQSFDEMIEIAEQIRDEGGVPFFEAGGDQWPTQWTVQVQLAEAAEDGLWGRLNANEEQFTSPTILGAIERYQSMVEDGLYNEDYRTATFVEQAEAVLNGDAAMAVQVNALVLQMQQTAETEQIDEAVGWFPISETGTIAMNIPDNKNGVVAFRTGDPEREAAAKQFLTYWLTDGYPTYVEALKTVSIEPDVPTPAGIPEVVQTMADAVGDSAGSMQTEALANPDLYINLANMLQGTQTPQEVAETTQRQFEQFALAQGAEGF